MIMNMLLASFANLVKCMNRRTQGNKVLMYPLDISTLVQNFCRLGRCLIASVS